MVLLPKPKTCLMRPMPSARSGLVKSKRAGLVYLPLLLVDRGPTQEEKTVKLVEVLF